MQPNPKRKLPAKSARPFAPMPFSKELAFERLSESRPGAAGLRMPIFSPGPPGVESPGWLSDLAALRIECAPESALAHPDMHMVQPESKSRRIVIDQIRDLEHAIQRKPLLGSSKVAIVHDADRMQQQAANAFLKTLEEPPPGSSDPSSKHIVPRRSWKPFARAASKPLLETAKRDTDHRGIGHSQIAGGMSRE